MAQFLEFEDKQVENAVERASRELNIPKDKLKYDVISYGATGIFGLVGAKKARIRVSVSAHKKPGKKRSGKPEPTPKAETPSPPHEQKSEQEDIADTISSLMEETFDAPTESEPPVRDAPPPAAEATAEPQEIASAAVEAEPAPPTSPEAAPPEDHAPAPETRTEETTEEKTEAQAPMELDEAAEAALEKGVEGLQRIIDSITEEARVVVEKEPDRVLLHVRGGNAGVLIGRRGQTLEAIQYLVEKIVNKHAANRIRVQVDIEGYLEGRRSRLEELAAKLSTKAKRTGKPVTLGQLNSHDRRIVHLSLRDDAAVRTQSMGDGFYRKLVIFPKKKGRKKKNA
jgi:spoIIIJ-associated protein